MISHIKKPIKFLAKNVRDLALMAGVGPKLKEDNRRVLESIIFPHFRNDSKVGSILFVGCHWYTWHYQACFHGKEFWTIEIDPSRARYGSSRHIIDSVENVEKHFAESSLDLVMILGVIGWGLDDPEAIERSLMGLKSVLKPSGILVVGCDEVPEHTPVDLSKSPTLGSMKPYDFPALGGSRYRCLGELKHTFTFYRK